MQGSVPSYCHCEGVLLAFSATEVLQPFLSHFFQEGSWFRHLGWHVPEALLFWKKGADPLTHLTSPFVSSHFSLLVASDLMAGAGALVSQ